jgi:hypothetical protein
MTSKVSDYMRNLIKKQVDDHVIVVWYDPEGYYKEFVRSLELPGTPLERYDGSFFALRHRIDPFIAGPDPRRLIVYVPLDRSQTHNALVEVEAAGVAVYPGAQPRQLNTRPSVVAKGALRGHLGDRELTSIEKQVEAGKLSLADLDRIGAGAEPPRGLISLIFGTSSPQEVALGFLSNEQHDEEILKKDAMSELSVLLQAEFELALLEGEPPKDLRHRLARHILATEFLESLQGNIPEQIASVKIATMAASKNACSALARTWRLRRDLRESYVNCASHAAIDLGISRLNLAIDQIRDSETFLEVERALLNQVEEALSQESREDLVEAALRHQSGFWAEQPDIQARWSLIAVAGQLLLEADRVEKDIRLSPDSARAVFDSYTSGEKPWLFLDTYYRNMEKRYHNLDQEIGDSLERLIIRAKERYMAAASKMAERFLRLYQRDSFRIAGVLRQVEIFEKIVKPALEEGKTAYIWADALRFEMARELLQIMSSEFHGEITPALAAAPTITEIGMAALLPRSSSGTIVKVDESKLALEIEGEVIRNRDERVKFLQNKTTSKFFEGSLDKLLPKPSVPISKAIQDADLVLITSREIDDLCERDDPSLARTFDLLSRLQKALRNLSRLGIKKIVVTSDHGYLFGDELGIDMKINPPGGDTADLHRRVWVGRGGASDPAYLRAKVSDFGLGGDLELATPWSFACFNAKSRSMSYFHGGLSPQELIIPVLTLIPKGEKKKAGGNIAWSLDYGGRKLTTRYFSVNVSGKEKQSISDSEPPKIKLEIRDGGTCISKAVSASYGFEDATGVVQMKKANWAIEPNTITLSIVKDPSKKIVSLHLLDAATDVELAPSKEIEVAILQY